MDFFQFNNKEYLLVSNVFSKFNFIFNVTTKTADTIINRPNQVISQYGYHTSLSTDNELPHEKHLPISCQKSIDNITSSPHYPKSNGYIEYQVKTMKTALTTAKTSRKKTLDKVLQNIRSTPIGQKLPPQRKFYINAQRNSQVNPHNQLILSKSKII